jgi:hypothetical protein
MIPTFSFAFKFFNNILGINTRTFHFATNPVRHCQFCSMGNIVDPADETFLHLFLNCPTVRAWHDEFIRRYFNDINLNPVESIKFLVFRHNTPFGLTSFCGSFRSFNIPILYLGGKTKEAQTCLQNY